MRMVFVMNSSSEKKLPVIENCTSSFHKRITTQAALSSIFPFFSPSTFSLPRHPVQARFCFEAHAEQWIYLFQSWLAEDC
jgi:hypothetical protein